MALFHQLICLFIFSIILTYVASGQPIFKRCDSKEGSVKAVVIPGCTIPPCKLVRGSNTTFIVDFQTAGVVVSEAGAVVHGIVAGVPVPFPPPQTNACQKCGLTCPLKTKTSYEYKTVLFVKKSYPKLRVVVKWELRDSKTNEDVFCVLVPVELV